jgi:ketosteroid isomerase-like protein
VSAKAVADRMWAALESHEFEQFEALLEPELELWVGGDTFAGAAAIRAMHEGFLAAFPDLRHAVLDYFERDDTVALELRVTGTHTGPLRLPEGEVTPTGRPVVWESVDWMKVRDGLVASWRVYTDNLSFLRQVGLAS